MLDRYRRRKANAKLDALERDRDVAGLVALLRDDNPETVTRAAGALGRIGGREVVGALLAALDGAPDHTRHEIVGTLGRIGDPGGDREVVKALLATLDGAPDDTRREIVLSLGAIGDPVATETLIRLLRDAEVTGAAAHALAGIGGPVAVSALVDALTDPDFPGWRAPLRDALSRLLPPLRRPEGLPRRLSREAVAEARRLLWAGDLDAAATLLDQIRDGIRWVEATAATRWPVAPYAAGGVDSALATVSRQGLVAYHAVGPNAQPFELDAFRTWTLLLANLEALLSTLPEDLEEATTPAPVHVPVDASIVEMMIRLLRGSDDETAKLRRDTLISLHRMGLLDSVAALGSTLDDRYWAIRLAAVAALRKIDDPEAIAALRAKLDDENVGVRMAAVAVGAGKDGQVLRQAVRDPHDEVRAVSAMVAADLDDPRWADAIVPLLTDGERLARMHAGDALQRWAWTGDPVQAAISACAWDEVVAAGTAAAAPLMRMFEEAYRDDDPDKEPAMRALERLVTEHGRAIPDEVLRFGADLADFPGARRSLSDRDNVPWVDASGLRQACQEALDGGRRPTAD